MFIEFEIDGLPMKLDVSDTHVIGESNRDALKKSCAIINNFVRSRKTRKKKTR